jgi:hypothetical protein
MKEKISLWGTNNTSTNLTDSHTCAIGGVDLVVAVVLVPGGELLQCPGDVIGSTSVGVPSCIYAVGSRSR